VRVINTTTEHALVDSDQMSVVRTGLEAARHARLLELGVSTPACASSSVSSAPSVRSIDTLRVMQWNLLADGLSGDGFLVHPVLADWPVGNDSVPTVDGEKTVKFHELVNEIINARGNDKELEFLQFKYATAAFQRNLDAITDWQARQLQIQLVILSMGRPDILVFQEVDHYGSLADGLAQLGYSSQLSNASAPYMPAHLSGHHTSDAEGIANFCASIEQVGHAFVPELGSTAMRLAIERRGLTKQVIAAAEAAGIADRVVNPMGDRLARDAFVGLEGGSRVLLCRAGVEDPTSIDDDGVCIFWRQDHLYAESLRVRVYSDGKFGAALEVKLRRHGDSEGKLGEQSGRPDARPIIVMCAHLASGSTQQAEAQRLQTQVHSKEGLCSWISSIARRENDAVVLLALDANSHPQVCAPDGQASVWRSLRNSLGASVWDGHFDADGEPLVGEDPGPVQDPPVSVNKFRGPHSAQPDKIGLHAYLCIDHIFFDPRSMALRGHVYPPRRFLSAHTALDHVLPSLAIPSDHYPLVVDFVWV